MKTQTTLPKPNHFKESLPEAIDANAIFHPPSRLNQYQYQQLIDIKAERTENQRNLKTLLFTMSLCLSLTFVILGINWKFYESGDLVDLGIIDDSFEELTEVPISSQPPPPPPIAKIENVVIVEVENEEVLEELDLNIDVEITQADVIDDVVYDDMALDIEQESAEEIFQIVEDKPEPEGGISSFYTYVAETLHYPTVAKRLGVSGVVYVRFVVEKDGDITDANVIKGIGAGCDEEAVKVINNAPNWIPGKQRGKPVRVYMTVPIRFILRE